MAPEIRRYLPQSITDTRSVAYNYQKLKSELLSEIEINFKKSLSDKNKYWFYSLTRLRYLTNASNEVLERLREHTHLITGVDPYDYVYGSQTGQYDNLRSRIDALKIRNPNVDIFPERLELAGFGFQYSDGVYNVDTLKYHEIIIGLKESLEKRNLATDRIIFVEIGSGYGGLSDCLLHHFPNSKLILIDFPELLLIAGTFLSTWRPGLKISVHGSDKQESDWDVLLMSNNSISTSIFPQTSIKVAVNSVSFQEMTSQEISDYSTFLYEGGIDLIYSLNKPHSNYNIEKFDTHDLLKNNFKMFPVTILPTPYTSALKNVFIFPYEIATDEKGKKKRLRDYNEYQHYFGVPKKH